MNRKRLYLLMAMMGIILSIMACGPKATPVEEAAPAAPVEEVATPKPEVVAVGISGEGETEPNNTFDEAMPIETGIRQGVLGAGDEDFYRFEVPNGVILKIEFAGLEGDCFDVKMFDPKQKEIGEFGCIGEVTDIRFMNNSSGGTYYLAVAGPWEDYEGSYTIELILGMQDDSGAGGDAGDDFDTATAIEQGKYSGEIGDYDQVDYYQFEVPNRGIMKVEFIGIEGGCFYVKLLDSTQKKISETDCTEEVTDIRLMNNSSGGAYYLAIESPWEDYKGSYTIEFMLEMQDDSGAGVDAGDDFDTATPIEKGEYFGQAGDFDQEDFYQFEAVSDTVLEFYSDIDAVLWFEIVLFDAGQKAVTDEITVFSGERDTIDFSERELAPGLYFLRIVAEDEGGRYIVELR